MIKLRDAKEATASIKALPELQREVLADLHQKPRTPIELVSGRKLSREHVGVVLRRLITAGLAYQKGEAYEPTEIASEALSGERG